MWLYSCINWAGFSACMVVLGLCVLRTASCRKRPGGGKDDYQTIMIIAPTELVIWAMIAVAIQRELPSVSSHIQEVVSAIGIPLTWVVLVIVAFRSLLSDSTRKPIIGMPCYYICWNKWVYFPEGIRAPLKWYRLGCVYPGILTRNVGKRHRVCLEYYGSDEVNPNQLYIIANTDSEFVCGKLDTITWTDQLFMIEMALMGIHCPVPGGLGLPNEWWHEVTRELKVKP